MSRPELAQARAFIQRATELGILDEAPSDARVELLTHFAFEGVKVIAELTEGFLDPRIESFRGKCRRRQEGRFAEFEATFHVAEVDREPGPDAPLYIAWVDTWPRPVFIHYLGPPPVFDPWVPYHPIAYTSPPNQHRWSIDFPSAEKRILVVQILRARPHQMDGGLDSSFELAPGPESRRFREWLDSHM
jgi:hypothetical protein